MELRKSNVYKLQRPEFKGQSQVTDIKHVRELYNTNFCYQISYQVCLPLGAFTKLYTQIYYTKKPKLYKKYRTDGAQSPLSEQAIMIRAFMLITASERRMLRAISRNICGTQGTKRDATAKIIDGLEYIKSWSA